MTKNINSDDARNIDAAEAILKLANSNICKSVPELMMFTPLLKYIAVEEDILLETDGRLIFYNADKILELFQKRRLNEVENSMLHILAHGILGHFTLVKDFQNTDIADIAMDFVSESFCEKGFNCKRTSINDDFETFMSDYEEDIFHKLKKMNTTELYYHLLTNPSDCAFMEDIRNQIDDHSNWNCESEYTWINEDKENIYKNDLADDADESTNIWTVLRQVLDLSGSDAEQILSELKVGYGTDSGNMKKRYSADKGRAYSYQQLLTELLVNRETSSENPDSIDRMLYSYGFSMYDDVALIEPEELSESKVLSSIAIAIDTSGSCDGDTMRKFLRETKAILSYIKDVCSFQKIYIFQCDSQIQYEKCIDDPCDLITEEKSDVYGFGGTSFIPVFDRLSEISKKESIDALIYYTDGLGLYPDKEPGYPVVFVTPKECSDYIPDWIKTIELQDA